MNKAPLICLLFLLIGSVFAGLLHAQQQDNHLVGKLDYFDGTVDVFKNGEHLSAQDVFMGLGMERYDLLATGEDGYAEVAFASSLSNSAMVKILEQTAFYFDYENNYEKKRAIFKLLVGSLSMKVGKLAGSAEITVETRSAVLGVRGTAFKVITAPDSSLLVTCAEGTVECRNKRGDTLFAEPGQVVEQLKSEQLRSIRVDVSDLEKFENQWITQKVDLFLANSLGSLKQYTQTYLEYREKFNRAYNALMQHNQMFRRWEQQRQQQSYGSIAQDKIAVSTDIFRMRSILFLFEQAFYRIWRLENLYDDGNMKKGMLWSGYSTDDFFTDFQREKTTLTWKMAQVRHIFKLYSALRWDLSPGSESMMDDVFSGENPLDDEDFFEDF